MVIRLSWIEFLSGKKTCQVNLQHLPPWEHYYDLFQNTGIPTDPVPLNVLGYLCLYVGVKVHHLKVKELIIIVAK